MQAACQTEKSAFFSDFVAVQETLWIFIDLATGLANGGIRNRKQRFVQAKWPGSVTAPASGVLLMSDNVREPNAVRE